MQWWKKVHANFMLHMGFKKSEDFKHFYHQYFLQHYKKL